MARSKAYWQARRKKQLGRFGGKIAKSVAQPSVASVARAAWSGVKYLRTLVNSELHKLDGSGSTTISTTPTVMTFHEIAQGDTDSARTGLSILHKGFYTQLIFTKHASATFTQVRVAIVQDRQQIADTAPAYTDVFRSSGILAKVNNNNPGRFKILYDKIFVLSTQHDYQQIKVFRKMSFHARYNGTAASDISKNGIYAFIVSSEATNTPTVTYDNRVYWHDN